MIQIQLVEEEF